MVRQQSHGTLIRHATNTSIDISGPRLLRQQTMQNRHDGRAQSTFLPWPLAEPISEVVALLRGSDMNHYVYPAETIHLTIQNLDPLMPEASGLEELNEKLRFLIGSFPPMRMACCWPWRFAGYCLRSDLSAGQDVGVIEVENPGVDPGIVRTSLFRKDHSPRSSIPSAVPRHDICECDALLGGPWRHLSSAKSLIIHRGSAVLLFWKRLNWS
jgi:hypothetical protein